ncbi:ABC-F type ribosomal protection protein [Proteinivorax tanatarense]|uniref:ABC-F type ribosomal protection protein n=1 Tax=Proteinivorax tanatarense TaxID=1260629 RepID=A0AAU7VJG3_9FIRM
MSTIEIQNMSFYYSKFYKEIFKDVNLKLHSSWKLGLVGRNGRGKTTLLNLINNDLQPSTGKIKVPLNTEKFPFAYKENYTKTIDIVKENIANYHQLENIMTKCVNNWNKENSRLYGNVIEKYENLNGYSINSMIEREFNYIGLAPDTLYRDFKSLSGGEKQKALLVSLFLKKNSFLLIDEPTNHLDLKGRKNLSRYLSQKNGFIVVSHDRNFLDGCIDHVLSINKETIYLEKGNFSSWIYNKNIKEGFETRTKKNIEKQVKILEESANKNRRWSADKEKEKIGCRGNKGAIGSVAARLMKRSISIERRTNQMLKEKKNLLKNYETAKELYLSQSKLEEDLYIATKDLSFCYGDKKIIDKLNFKVFKGDRLWVKGKNGCGKTTLLKIISGDLKGTAGKIEKNSFLNISVGNQNLKWTQGSLNNLLIQSKISKNKFRNILSYFDLGEEYFDRPIETFSQGELKKIDITRALCTDNHLFIWDEPLNFMDILFRTQLEEAILKFKPTIIFVEHDETFGKSVANKILSLR